MENEPDLNTPQRPVTPPHIPHKEAGDMLAENDANVANPPQLPATRPNAIQPAQNQGGDDLVRCPYCNSTQFFGSKKVTGMGWFLYISAIANLFISGLLMFVFIGFLTIFASPILAIIGFYGCRKHVNTCAKCKHDF